MATFEPIDHDPFATKNAATPTFVPVEHNPFASFAPTVAPKQEEDTEGQGIPAIFGRLKDRAVEAYQGKQDPAYSGLPAYDTTPASTEDPRASARMLGSMATGADDAGYADIIQKGLGDKFIRRFKDKNGYEIIEHFGRDGKPTQAYVNKPGLDMSDVTRGFVGAIPYVIGGEAIAGIKGLGLVGEALAQTGVGAATSVAGDLGSKALGSDQAVDPTKALVIGGLGGAATLAAPAVGSAWRKFVTEPGLVDEAGVLTQKGAEAALKAGLDPNAIQGEVAKKFAQGFARTADEAAAALEATTTGSGVRTTVGQRTKDPEKLMLEKNMRYGVEGDKAKAMIKQFDAEQRGDIRAMLLGERTPESGAAASGAPGIARQLDPDRAWNARTPALIGEDIQSGIQSARAVAKAQENAAWKEVPDLVGTPEAFATLPAHIERRLGDFRITTETPNAAAMENSLAAFVNGTPVTAVTKLINQKPLQTIDDMRRFLKKKANDAVTPSDKSASAAIYDAYKDWTMEAAEQLLFKGDNAKAGNLLKAIDLTKQLHAVFEPKGPGFKPNAATEKLRQVLGGADTPEKIVSALFGQPGSRSAEAKTGAVQALNAMKTSLTRYLPPAEGIPAWNAIRIAHYMKMIQNANGELLGYPTILNNLKTAANSQSTLMNVLYSPADMAAIKRAIYTLEQVVAKDPNGSGTASGLGAMVKDVVKRLYGWLPTTAQGAIEATHLPQMMSSAMGVAKAREALAPGVLKTTTNPTLAIPATSIGSSVYPDRRPQ